MSEPAVETSLREVALDLQRRAAGRRPAIFEPRDWLRRMIEQSLDDDQVRTALFRFVDVLPSLRGAREVGDHLEQYFANVDHALGGLTLLAHTLHASWLVAPIVRKNVTVLARRFIAPNDPDSLREALEAIRAAPAAFTIDLVGEAIVSEAEAVAMLGRYEALLADLAAMTESWAEVARLDRDDRGPLPRVDVSVKLSSLYARFDPLDPDTEQVVAKRLRRLDIPKIRRAELMVTPLRDPSRLNGSGLVLINPPWTLEGELKALLPALAGLLGREGAGRFTLDWLAEEGVR